ncbi:ATP-dependent DNA ligase protein [Rhizobium phage RHph_I46]|uniref:DNA ligase n=1 Tax=Rhizobium phage RHph_I1_9 TaxID=2509729 RepID=A0A7S5RIN6_9CAUD|nr:ATP-dependent DNA ligase protein [Rhizobium phage RHph_I1_9]QIG69742.1 ATP-dependent DNA ligase protein [Rhizobium phage RHph_I46]QIG71023.1 ATP-dependent DNA ligase protein [Rhizobium phage RHph_I9]QIG73609.1 ATP-dependent DNA ligase protein [Rhizobium phage RHph_I1_9]QIG76362.1 ATP-dependent DNA ligase protein [Rhizobium phage RHph_I34]
MLDIFSDNTSEADSISNTIDSDLRAIADSKGTNAKKIELAKISEFTYKCYVLHLDPFKRFGISKLKDAGGGEGMDWSTIFTLLDQGNGRELNRRGKMLTDLQAKIINGIFDGFQDWKPGVKGASFLECFPGAYTTFEVQKCANWDPDLFEEGSFAQTKFDGIRCVAAVGHDGVVTYLSRNGRPVVNVDPRIEENLRFYPGWCFDSEADSPAKFQKTSGISRASKSGSNIKLTLRVFDAIPYDAFFARKYDVGYIDRYTSLQNQWKDNEFLYDLIAEHEEMKTWEDAQKFYEAKRALGCEGAIVKKRNGTYNFERDDSWMKVKPLETIEARIIGKEEGNPKTKHVGRVGALIVQDYTGAISRVGSGMSDKLRQEIWDNWDEYENSLCEVKFMERTESGVFRHSRLSKIRLDKDDMNPTGA